jgi:hypothetical protein
VAAEATFANVDVSATSSELWDDSDIGPVGVAGSSTTDGASRTVSGAGADVWGAADAFHYAYQAMTGDGQIAALVTSQQNTNAWAKAGVMMRDTLAANSAHAFMLASPGKGTAFQRRTVAGGSSTSTGGVAVGAPIWVKLVRAGDQFTAYTSADGFGWDLVGSETIAMNQTIYVGLASSSHTTAAVSAATFDYIAVGPDVEIH